MKIVTDSAADLTAEDIQRWGISVAPLSIHFPEQDISSADLSADEFYNRLRAMAPHIPTTAQPSVGVFTKLYSEIGPSESILSIHISSGLSGTAQAARVAAENVGNTNITIVDCLTLSGGQRFQVLAAAMAAQKNWAKPAIIDTLDVIRAATETIFTLDTLDYLVRGGRIGRVQALAGSLLKIKPVIQVDKADGKYNNMARGRTLQHTMTTIADHFTSHYGASEPMWVTVLHGQFAEKADIFLDMLKGKLNMAKLEILRVSPVLGVHTGPGVVGAAVVPMRCMNGLLD